MNAHLTDGIQSDDQLPNSLFKGCFLVRKGGVPFYTISVLLVLELGNLTVHPTAHRLKPLLVAVILTVREGFRNCTSTRRSFDPELILQTLVRSDIPLLKVVYRDSEPPSSVLSPIVH